MMKVWYHTHPGRTPGFPLRDYIFFIMKLFRAGIMSVCGQEVAVRGSRREDETLDGDRNDLGLSLFPAVIIQTLLFMYLEWKDKIPSPAPCRTEVLKLFRTRRVLRHLPQLDTSLTVVKNTTAILKICNKNQKKTGIQLKKWPNTVLYTTRNPIWSLKQRRKW